MSSELLTMAQIGTSLFAAKSATDAMESNLRASIARAGTEAGRAAFAGPLERYQIRRSAEYTERLRSRDFAASVGAQRASSAAAGVVGGRTQRLIEARSQAEFTRQESMADTQTRFALAASRERERVARENAKMQMSDAGRRALAQGNQITTSFLGDLFQIASQNSDMFGGSGGTTKEKSG